jgi:hypothetical protein
MFHGNGGVNEGKLQLFEFLRGMAHKVWRLLLVIHLSDMLQWRSTSHAACFFWAEGRKALPPDLWLPGAPHERPAELASPASSTDCHVAPPPVRGMEAATARITSSACSLAAAPRAGR